MHIYTYPHRNDIHFKRLLFYRLRWKFYTISVGPLNFLLIRPGSVNFFPPAGPLKNCPNSAGPSPCKSLKERLAWTVRNKSMVFLKFIHKRKKQTLLLVRLTENSIKRCLVNWGLIVVNMCYLSLSWLGWYWKWSVYHLWLPYRNSQKYSLT